ncbi:MAG: hypothetical protein IPL53_21055 [Ignavibacteria bacterium]|nr:hypothetical protein [Ignavibacteria bacterium]
MKDSKLAEILSTLTPKEFRELEKFAASPYFAVGRDLTLFLKCLKSFYPDFSHRHFTAEYIYSKLYPEKGDSGKVQQTIKTLSSDLIHLCKRLFKQLEFEEDFNRGNFYLSNQLRNRKLYRDFEKEYKLSYEQQKISDSGGIKDFIDRYFLNTVFRDYSLEKDDFINAFEFTLSSDENLVAVALMVSFMLEDEKNISEGYNLPLRYTIMGNLLDCLDSEKLLSEMKKNNDRFYPYVLIFFMIYKMNKYKNKREYFFELKNLLVESQSLFGQSENYVFWNMLNSYCGVNQLFDESLNIYRYILENNIYKKTGEDFHIILFRNIVSDFTHAGEFEWLDYFIEKYSKELHIKHRENMHNFSYGYLNFAKRNFEKALQYLSKVNYDLFVYKIDVRLLLLKIYYELSYFEQAYSLIDSTIHFLRNTTEFSEQSKSEYRNFVKSIKKFLNIKSLNETGSYSAAFLKEKISEAKTGSLDPWLREKIKELIE